MSCFRRPALACGLMLVLAAPEAAAFCRKTTCNPLEEVCKTDASGCAREGTVLRWTTSPIVYRFHVGGSKKLARNDETRKSVRAAFQRWSDVECGDRGRTSLRFQEIEDATGEKLEPFTIYFHDEEWPSANGELALALTSHGYGPISGRIKTSIIEVNTAVRTFATRDDVARDDAGVPVAIDLESVITHEVGHYIGLDHSEDLDSIMAPTHCMSDDRCRRGPVEARRLGRDDEEAVCTLYPPEDQVAAKAPEASCGVGSSARGWGGAVLPTLAVLALALVRRHRATDSTRRRPERT